MALDPAHDLAHGIYGVRFATADGAVRDGVASYGRRPTFGGGDPVLETFVFDFAGDLYGEVALVSFYGFIRTEERFDSVAKLVARMEVDSIEARALLERMPSADLDRALQAAWRQATAAGGQPWP
jgi:riboflavin kinase/FMN adenylyltransferase